MKLLKVYVDLPSGRQAVSIPPVHSDFHSLSEQAYWLLLEGPQLERLSLYSAHSADGQLSRQPAEAMDATEQQTLRRVLSQLTIPDRANAPLWVLLSRAGQADLQPPNLTSHLPDADFLDKISQKFLHGFEQDRLEELRELVEKRYQNILSVLGKDRYSSSLYSLKDHFFQTLVGRLSYAMADELISRMKEDDSIPQPGPAKTPAAPQAAPAAPPTSAVLEVDPISVNIGRALIGLASPKQGQQLVEKIKQIRNQLGLQVGIVLPGVRIRDDLRLKPDEYKIMLRTEEVAGGRIRPNQSLMMGQVKKLKELVAAQDQDAWVKDPLYSLPAVWSYRGTEKAEPLGLLEVDALSVFANHLSDVLVQSAAELFCYQSYGVHMERNAKRFPHLHEALEKRQVDPVKTWQILRELLSERVSVRDLNTILETILIQPVLPLEELVEKCRIALARQITRFHLNSSSHIEVVMLTADQERALRESTEVGLRELYLELTGTYQESTDRGWGVNFLVAPDCRRPLRDLLMLALPRAYFLSTSEMLPGTQVVPLDLHEGQPTPEAG